MQIPEGAGCFAVKDVLLGAKVARGVHERLGDCWRGTRHSDDSKATIAVFEILEFKNWTQSGIMPHNDNGPRLGGLFLVKGKHSFVISPLVISMFWISVCVGVWGVLVQTTTDNSDKLTCPESSTVNPDMPRLDRAIIETNMQNTLIYRP
jgi:hypothetical protein